jgi:hypothetical protein
MRLVWHVAWMRMKITHTGILIKTLKEGHCLEDTAVDERIILKWVLNVMTQNMDQWCTLVNMSVDFQNPHNA